jgi:hypothetical protein
MCSTAPREVFKTPKVDLKYPVAYIEHDLAALIYTSPETSVSSLKSITMASRSTIPLGESSYDLIQNSRDLLQDEDDLDDNAGSLASVDELESLTGTDFSINTTSGDSDAESAGIPAFAGLDRGHGSQGDIASSSATTAQALDNTSRSIELDEVDMIGTEHVTVSRTIRHFNETEAAAILKQLEIKRSPTHLITTLKETLAKSRLDIDGSFHVLYVGDSSAKDDIISQVGSALAAPLVGANPSQIHLRSSRFSVIPISDFGSRQIPTIELVDSFGVELVVDHCTTARTTKTKDSADLLHLQLNDSVWISSKYDSSRFYVESYADWRLPHVAILFWGEGDNNDAKKTLRYTRAFLARHEIPCINISQNGSFERQNDEFCSPDPHSIHMCLEVRTTAGHENRILKRFPVELSTFLSLDSRQMNRNLAFLTGQKPERKGLNSMNKKNVDNSTQASLYDDAIQWLPNFKRRQAVWQQSIPSFALFLIFVSSVIYLLASTDIGRSPRQLDMPTSSSMPTSCISSTSRDQKSFVQSSTVEPLSISSPIKTESQIVLAETRALAGPIADLASLLSDPMATSLNKSDRFELHVIGDCHMILKPSCHFGKLRRPPPLFVKATRNGSSIPVNFTKLFDGVYALHLNPEDAHSVVDIYVWTESRPVVKESFELDFGTPWLKIASWRRTASMLSTQLQKDLSLATDSLSTALGHVSTDVMAAYSQASVQASSARARLRNIQISDIRNVRPFHSWDIPRHSSPMRAMAKDLVIYKDRMSSAVSTQAARIYNAASSVGLIGLWHDLHFVHARDTISEARRHAQILWARHVSRTAQVVAPRKKTAKGYSHRHQNTCKGKSR